ncbi:MAG: M56 family metallopeptidase [Prolixibacteraceae bacterium]|jgi:TonB family protein|nr:M56 family metallopeptidase [Prolixibacteraceae bacterium]MDI9564986.1 M56 family metallopeptidase [Bacteroidota bacterium]NLS99553.1 M56 family metallopeptidase [Bacteroidales bacterium]HNZ69732.1 M56 family metallopeptidase [Prolixibacteraceae bacterium]HOC87127.1 M56 family metallopeptidase [Prolixibacteraceae bacterium]
MHNLVNYLLESGVSLTLFALVYLLFLRRETFFRTNRLFLLFSVLFSLLLPLLAIPVLAPRAVILPEVTVTPYRNLLETVLVERQRFSGNVEQFVISSRLIVNLWLAGVLVMAIISLLRLGQILRIIRKGKVTDSGDFKMVLNGRESDPFSFMNYLFIPEDYAQIPGYDQIVYHEREHIRQGHTWDILLLDILLVFQWFNPFIWMLKRAVRENHEYLVDRAVLRSGMTPADYKNLLLSEVVGSKVFAAHHFNNSLLKNRFKMMTKIPSRKAAGIKIVSGLMIALALVVVFACEKKTSTKLDAGAGENLTIEPSDSLLKISGSREEVRKLDSILGSRNYEMITMTDQNSDRSYILLKSGDPGKGTSPVSETLNLDELQDESEVFFIVEEMPEYPGGEAALRKFISEKILYPVIAQENGIQGKVYVSFVVSADGSVRNARIARGVDPVLDKEALRVVNSMPRWTPGKQRGKAVNVSYTVPISFVLQ